MTTKLKIDFVSDIACPWCAVGLHSLLTALKDFEDQVDAEFIFHPFELAPDMPAQGEKTRTHLSRKYGIPESQVVDTQRQITQRGSDAGFTFNLNADSMKWNTFNCHRVLHWAGKQNSELQLLLKKALLEAFFTDNLNPGDPHILKTIFQEIGQNTEQVDEILSSEQIANEVRDEEHQWIDKGVSSVPTMVFNNRYAVSGGQPIETFRSLIQQMIDESSANAL